MIHTNSYPKCTRILKEAACILGQNLTVGHNQVEILEIIT